MRLICHRVWCILHRTLLTQMAMPLYIAYYRSNGVDQLFRKLKPKPKLNPPNAHRSQFAKIGKRKMCSFRSCQTRFEFLSQFRKVRNAFECFVTQVQTRLPKTKCVWPMKINVICTVCLTLWSCIDQTNVSLIVMRIMQTKNMQAIKMLWLMKIKPVDRLTWIFVTAAEFVAGYFHRLSSVSRVFTHVHEQYDTDAGRLRTSCNFLF